MVKNIHIIYHYEANFYNVIKVSSTMVLTSFESYMTLMRVQNLKSAINNTFCITTYVFVLDPVKYKV